MSEALSELEVQSFTSWKLDILDAISCDIDLQDIDVRVAFRLMQHVNARTREAHPSLERLAAQVGVSRDTVMRSLTRMSDPEGGRYWISRTRTDRTLPYVYSFVNDRLNAVVDGKLDREDKARETSQERRRKRFEVAAVQPREVATDAVLEVANDEGFEVAAVQPKHLHNNYLNRTPDSSCSEGSEGTYTRESDPTESSVSLGPSPANELSEHEIYPIPTGQFDFDATMFEILDGRQVQSAMEKTLRRMLASGTLTRGMAARLISPPVPAIPTSESEFGVWVKDNIPDPTRHREAFRLLREQKMTPEILRRLAA